MESTIFFVLCQLRINQRYSRSVCFRKRI
uniref:Uncharacterized protein n=1 Tax=Arundo donax TaxID=35708 RepID=A0A0A8ZI51_ARUDO